MSKKYIFHNFTDKPFTGYWNGKPYTFKPGAKKYYVKLIAEHFAKHLTNEILVTKDANGNNQERFTSPKKPEDVPVFMNIFEKALIVEEVADEDDLDIDGENNPSDAPSMDINVKPREVIDQYNANATPQTGPAGPSMVVPIADDGDDYEETPAEETSSESK